MSDSEIYYNQQKKKKKRRVSSEEAKKRKKANSNHQLERQAIHAHYGNHLGPAGWGVRLTGCGCGCVYGCACVRIVYAVLTVKTTT